MSTDKMFPNSGSGTGPGGSFFCLFLMNRLRDVIKTKAGSKTASTTRRASTEENMVKAVCGYSRCDKHQVVTALEKPLTTTPRAY